MSHGVSVICIYNHIYIADVCFVYLTVTEQVHLFTKVYPWRQVAEGGFVGVVSVAAEELQALGAE